MGRPLIEHADATPEMLMLVIQRWVDRIIFRDGDRDHMNYSNLTVEETLALSDLLRVIEAKFGTGATS